MARNDVEFTDIIFTRGSCGEQKKRKKSCESAFVLFLLIWE